jgi:hypothetical protein
VVFQIHDYRTEVFWLAHGRAHAWHALGLGRETCMILLLWVCAAQLHTVHLNFYGDCKRLFQFAACFRDHYGTCKHLIDEQGVPSSSSYHALLAEGLLDGKEAGS